MKSFIQLSLIILFISFFVGCSDSDWGFDSKDAAHVYVENLSDENTHLYINDEVMSPANLFAYGQSKKRIIWTVKDEYTDVTIYAGRDGKVIATAKIKVKTGDVYSCNFLGSSFEVLQDSSDL